MLLHWYGHACFLLSSADTKIMTDPFNEKVGYRLPEDKPDYVTVSHDHHDHSSVGLVHGTPQVKRTPESEKLGDFLVYGIESHHDPEGGTKRGQNIIFVFEHEGVRLAHLGDLGHTLSSEQLIALGRVDVLLIPVGGVYTIDAKAACQVIKQVGPRLVVPMHYNTRDLSIALGEVQEFCDAFSNTVFSGQCTLNLTPNTLPSEQQVVVMEYCNKS